jgi:hypothetical protein
MPGTIDRIAAGEYQTEILGGLEPYAQALLEGGPGKAHSFGFDVRTASRPKRVKILSPYAASLLVARVGVQIAEGGFEESQATVGELQVFALPPGTGTGESFYQGTAPIRKGNQHGAIPILRRIGLSQTVRAEAVFGILAFDNDEEHTPVAHAMRVVKLVSDTVTEKVMGAAMLGQSEDQFIASMQDHVPPEPAAFMTIAAYGDTEWSRAPWLANRESIYNGTPYTLVLGRIAIAEGAGDGQLDIFRLLEAAMPTELAA